MSFSFGAPQTTANTTGFAFGAANTTIGGQQQTQPAPAFGLPATSLSTPAASTSAPTLNFGPGNTNTRYEKRNILNDRRTMLIEFNAL